MLRCSDNSDSANGVESEVRKMSKNQNEINNSQDIKKLLYQKVPKLIEKLEVYEPEQCVAVLQTLKAIADFPE